MFGHSKKVMMQPFRFRPLQAGQSTPYYDHHDKRVSPIPGQPYNPAWSGQYQMMQGPFMQPYTGYPNYMQANPNMNGYGMYQNGGKQNGASNLFENPLQTNDYQPYVQNMHNSYNGYPGMNPYPANMNIPRPPSGFQSVLNSFKNQDGTVDINKMVNTAGQMMNAFTQVSSMVKGLGGIFKV